MAPHHIATMLRQTANSAAARIGAPGMLAGAALGLALLLAGGAKATTQGDAEATVIAFRDGLAGIAQRSLPLPQRAQALSGVLAATVDLDRIATVAVGSSRLASWSGDDRAEVLRAFRDYMAAVVAERLETIAFAGLAVTGTRQGPSGSMIVDASIAGEPPISFLLHRDERGWRILDVLRGGISELALRRSEFAAAADRGADVLAQRLEARTATLLDGVEP